MIFFSNLPCRSGPAAASELSIAKGIALVPFRAHFGAILDWIKIKLGFTARRH